MRKVRLVAVGRIKEKFFAEAVAEYAKRLSRYADFSMIELPESPTEDVAAESAAILKQLKGYTILFDLRGEQLSSEAFAAKMDAAYSVGDTVTLVIGSSRGVSDEVSRAAALSVAFGKATFPHMLFRVMAVEQIYRAFTILNNGKYHK